MIDLAGAFASGLAGWLVAGMKAIVCAVVYWMFFWIWPWFAWGLNKFPSSVTEAPSTILVGAADVYQVADIFLPVQECFAVIVAFWGWVLVMRLFKVVDQIKSI